MRTLSQIFSIIWLALSVTGLVIFALSVGTGRLRIDYLLLSGMLLLLAWISHQEAKKGHED